MKYLQQNTINSNELTHKKESLENSQIIKIVGSWSFFEARKLSRCFQSSEELKYIDLSEANISTLGLISIMTHLPKSILGINTGRNLNPNAAPSKDHILLAFAVFAFTAYNFFKETSNRESNFNLGINGLAFFLTTAYLNIIAGKAVHLNQASHDLIICDGKIVNTKKFIEMRNNGDLKINNLLNNILKIKEKPSQITPKSQTEETFLEKYAATNNAKESQLKISINH